MRITTGLVSTTVCAVLVLAGGCGVESTPQEETTNTVTAEQPPETAAPPAPAEESQSGGQWAMPNLVGTVLQDAQDQIQALSGGAVYFTSSHDLGGQDRNQVLDANWKVCTQNIASGAALTAESRVDFGVVKIDETCP